MVDNISWKELTLADLGKVVTGKTPSTLNSAYFGGDIPFVTPTDMDDRRIISTTERYLTEQGAEAIKGSRIPAGTVMVSCIGSQMGKVAIAGKSCVTNQQINSIVVSPEYSELFVYYSLSLRGDEIRSRGSGSAVPILNKTDFSHLPILVPPLPEQRAITEILGALDDKIELNRRMNATLESMALAVFRQWFVESEELKGWDDLKWGDIATLEYGKSLSDYKFSDAPYVVYGTNGPIGRHTEALYPSEGIIIGRKGAYRGIHYSPNPFFVIDTAFYLKPQKPLSMKWAYYELLRLDLNSMDSGSAIPSTSRTDFYNLPVIFPSQEIMNSFEAFVAPLFSKIYANAKESRTLASMRDSLLPKLMRGEVRVSAL